MKFSLSWLKRHLETNHSIEEIAQKLTALGLEVESITSPGEGLKNFKIGLILETVPHPNADKLRICKVDIGEETPIHLVCGAPNARPGIKVVFAPLGTVIPQSQMRLKPAIIRGVESCGMLCSKQELTLAGDASEGIWELDLHATVGQSLIEYLNLLDPVVELSLTPNRGDCLGIRGIARELAAAGFGTLKPLPPLTFTASEACPIPVHLSFSPNTENACPHFTGRLIRGVKNGPSPLWLQQALQAVGLKSISALVDVTNFFSQDLCRPLHVFDASKIRGSLTVRLAKPGETLLALDGKTYTLDDTMTVISDEKNVLALGGILGGLDTGCTVETTDVFLEAAYFNPIRTTQTGRKLGILSDARHRFERGIDPLSAFPGLDLATQMIIDLCGGVATDVISAGSPLASSHPIMFDLKKICSLVGMEIPPLKVKTTLENLGCVVQTINTETLAVTPPSWRMDLNLAEDLVEEVIRVEGYDTIPIEPLPPLLTRVNPLNAQQKRTTIARQTLAQRSLTETVSWSMVDEPLFTLFGGKSQTLRIINPITQDLTWMRPSLLPGLLKAVHFNINKSRQSLGLFEVGPLYQGTHPEDQETAAAGVRFGALNEAHWGHEQRAYDIFDVKNDGLALLRACGINTEKIQVKSDHIPSWMHPYRSGLFCQGPQNILGYFGEIHPSLLKMFGLKAPVMAFEMKISRWPFPKATPSNKGTVILWPLQPIEKDLAFIVDKSLSAQTLIESVMKTGKPLVTSVQLFDLYEGPHMGEGKKSLAVRLRIQPQETTLTDEDVQHIFQKIVQSVQKDCGGVLRDGQ